MNAQAGDIERGFLRQQEHLAPLPIPTGQLPQDLMNIIWRKNSVYLDIGSFAMGGGYDPAWGNPYIPFSHFVVCHCWTTMGDLVNTRFFIRVDGHTLVLVYQTMA
jgi:hypothetical protein